METTAGRVISTVSATFSNCIWGETGCGSSSGTVLVLSLAGWGSGWTVDSTAAFAETIPALLVESDAGTMAWLFDWAGVV